MKRINMIKIEHYMSKEDEADGYPTGIFTPPSMPTGATTSAGTVSFVTAWKAVGNEKASWALVGYMDR